MRRIPGKILLCGLLSLLLLLSVCFLVYADTAADLTEDYTASGVPDREQDTPPAFHGIVGAGLFNYKKVVGDEGRRNIVLPIVLMTYKDRAYWSLGGGGVWLLQSEDRLLKFGVGVKARLGWRPDDDALLEGMSARRTSLDGSVNAMWKASLATVSMHYYTDIGNVSHGKAATMRLSHNLWANARLRLTPSVGVEWQNARLVDYYYGVRPDEATATRPVYAGHDTLNFNAGLAGAYWLGREWSLLGGVYATHYGDGIGDSPIVQHRGSGLAYFGAGWRF